LRKHVLIEKEVQREFYNWGQCYDFESLKRLFTENGLYISDTYSDVAGAPYTEDSEEIAVVAKRVEDSQ
jgi:hypothetical protein